MRVIGAARRRSYGNEGRHDGNANALEAEAKENADYLHDSWNPYAHVELTLTISEIRAIHEALFLPPTTAEKE